ncbi:MAG: DUF3667 domain-containing protein [Gammaproteobacteria bacterium]|nr:DUF3667 domain-containing protein [Gammaproteobacteria bacterium]
MQCANCGNERALGFCAHCGQNDRDYLRSLPSLVRDIVREVFEVDSRTFRTLRLLVLRPGELSAEFSRNRRANYSSPIRLYLFFSLLFFFVLSVTSKPEPTVEEDPVVRFDEEQAESVDFTALREALSPQRLGKVDEILSRDSYPGTKASAYGLAFWADRRQDALTEIERFYISQGIDWLHAPRLAAERLENNLPITMFFMLPVFALLLALFHRKKQRFYVEHFVFSVHVHVAVFAVFTLLALVPDAMIGGILDLILLLALAVYNVLALFRYYGDGVFLTIVKWGFLTAGYAILLIPGILLTVFVTLSAL